MEIPVFNGENDAYWWVLCMDKYFGAMKTPEDKKMTEVVKAMRGRAFSWWFSWSLRHPKASWETFSWKLMWYFKPEYRDVLQILDDEDWLNMKLDDGCISMNNMTEVKPAKEVDPDRNFEGQTRNDAVGKEEVTTFTEFVTIEKLEKNEEKLKDKEMEVLKVITTSINDEEEDRIKGSESEEAMSWFHSRC
jgi:hypothetical protein